MNKKVMGLLLLGAVMTVEAKRNQLADIIERRHSGYVFDGTRPVTAEQIQVLVKAGQLAPSSFNDQPWYFIICDKTTYPEAYGKAFSTLVEFNQRWAQNAPILIIVLAATNSHHNEFNRWAQYDTGAAASNIMLQATSLGLMAHQMGGFDSEKVIKLFNVPANVVPMAIMAVGYAGAEPKAPKKERKSLQDNFFMGSWGAGIK